MSRRALRWVAVSVVAVLSIQIARGTDGDSGAKEADLEDVIAMLFIGGLSSEIDFEQGYVQAVELGASEQVLLEARIAKLWYKSDFPGMIELLPRITALRDEWNFPSSELFNSREEFNGYYYYFRALEAKEERNAAAFEDYIKESFWMNPDLSDTLAATVREYQRDARIASLVVPLDLSIQTSHGEPTTLGELVQGKKGLLIEFWATWCVPCLVLIPDLIRKAEKLEPQGVVVAGMNNESSVEKAALVREQRNIEINWLVEPFGAPLSRLLMIDSIPRMILVSPEGEVLYNGHPMDPTLKTILAKLDVTL